ncbi:aminotransferase class I/II-fold pyridoxal phosphate-dependent enzyme [Mesobaculum littorinae]|uniref:Aminotransferase n=2 Tax=Mesobaculum littorinae TaxID=2486419 RepID=A0A438AG12_9RHOB|nr:aminotransferase class I/II-fold pyridoxal phosphate-dependent enzyme [Mesobaculum littorinae]
MDTGQPVRVLVHPNNPDGRLWSTSDVGAAEAGMAGSSKTGISRAGSSRTHGHPQRSQPSGAPHSGGTRRAFAAPDWTIIDESFCDVVPGASHISAAARPGVVVLKSFGKFWGLAGLRLGFAAATPDTLSRLAEMLGPWPVSGPALEIGARALEDSAWAKVTRDRLGRDADRLDRLMQGAGARVAGGTTLFRLYEVEDAAHWQDRLGRAHILSRVFPYAPHWLRLGLPAPRDWPRVEAALC